MTAFANGPSSSYDPGQTGPALDQPARAVLLSLARDTIARVVNGLPPPAVDSFRFPPALRERRACFVTLTKRGALRGCIGNLEAEVPLPQSVADNAANAALRDSRFDPVRSQELSEINIEISVLGEARELGFETADRSLSGLVPFRHGVILESGAGRATFLPQVWEKFPSKEQFLDALARKAGAGAEDWRTPGARISVYETESFREAIQLR